jgi:hypothetical protein
MSLHTGFFTDGVTACNASALNKGLMSWADAFSDLPTAASSNAGMDVFCLDRKAVYQSNGSAWVLDAIAPPMTAQGDIPYWNGTAWDVLPATTAGYVLTTHGATSNPTFAAPTGITGNATQSQPTRVLGTVYHNTGSTKIDVAVAVTSTSGATNSYIYGAIAYSDSASSPAVAVNYAVKYGTEIAGCSIGNMSFTVPAGYYYQVTNATNATLQRWTEWTLT